VTVEGRFFVGVVPRLEKPLINFSKKVFKIS